jgi:hypothetical protein
VALNRRLSTHVYLDVVALHHDGSHYHFADIGPVREYYDALSALARTALQQGDSVVVDAAFSKRAQCTRIQDLAADMGAECYLIDCVAPETVIRERLEQRVRTPGSVSDGRWAIFPEFLRQYEPVQAGGSELGNAAYIRLDTTQPVEHGVLHALAKIQEGRAAYDSGKTHPRRG